MDFNKRRANQMVGPLFIFRANIPADLSDGNKESSDLNGQWERNWQS
jgi:hypothetical protein